MGKALDISKWVCTIATVFLILLFIWDLEAEGEIFGVNLLGKRDDKGSETWGSILLIAYSASVFLWIMSIFDIDEPGGTVAVKTSDKEE